MLTTVAMQTPREIIVIGAGKSGDLLILSNVVNLSDLMWMLDYAQHSFLCRSNGQGKMTGTQTIEDYVDGQEKETPN